MDIRKIRCFLCVARHLSFSRAAEELYLAQSTVSTQVEQLEQELGVTLLRRNKRKVELTAEGKLAIEEFSALIEQLDAVPEHLKSLSGGKKVLRIGLFGNGMTTYEAIVLQASLLFEQNHSNTYIATTIGEWGPLKDLLVANRLDIVFAPDSEAENYPMIHSIPLFRDYQCIAMPADDPFCEKESIKIVDLQNRCIVIPNHYLAPSTFRISRQFMENTFKKLPVFLEQEGSLNMLAAIRMHHGVGIFPRSFRPKTPQPDLRFINMEDDALYNTQAILYINEDPVLRKYIRFASEYIRDNYVP